MVSTLQFSYEVSHQKSLTLVSQSRSYETVSRSCNSFQRVVIVTVFKKLQYVLSFQGVGTVLPFQAVATVFRDFKNVLNVFIHIHKRKGSPHCHTLYMQAYTIGFLMHIQRDLLLIYSNGRNELKPKIMVNANYYPLFCHHIIEICTIQGHFSAFIHDSYHQCFNKIFKQVTMQSVFTHKIKQYSYFPFDNFCHFKLMTIVQELKGNTMTTMKNNRV